MAGISYPIDSAFIHSIDETINLASSYTSLFSFDSDHIEKIKLSNHLKFISSKFQIFFMKT